MGKKDSNRNPIIKRNDSFELKCFEILPITEKVLKHVHISRNANYDQRLIFLQDLFLSSKFVKCTLNIANRVAHAAAPISRIDPTHGRL